MLDSTYAEYALKQLREEREGKRKKGENQLLSAQELMDRMHIVNPPKDPNKWTHLTDPLIHGYPTTFRKGFEFLKAEGVYVEKQYPHVGTVQKFKLSDLHPVSY